MKQWFLLLCCLHCFYTGMAQQTNTDPQIPLLFRLDDIGMCHAVNTAAEEVLAFLKGNGVPLEHGDVSGLGIRIYFGMHHEANSFKPVPSIPGTPVESYYFKDTPILVVTKKGKDGNEDDQLSANDVITISGGGQGYDNARLCPPECNGGM